MMSRSHLATAAGRVSLCRVRLLLHGLLSVVCGRALVWRAVWSVETRLCYCFVVLFPAHAWPLQFLVDVFVGSASTSSHLICARAGMLGWMISRPAPDHR